VHGFENCSVVNKIVNKRDEKSKQEMIQERDGKKGGDIKI
jgi:hypothetical protein